VGLTEIGEVRSYIVEENEMIPIPGKLMYRGINVEKIVDGFLSKADTGSRRPPSCCCSARCPQSRSWRSSTNCWAG
jgi:hypothetical protein